MAVGFQWSMYSAVLLLSAHAAQVPNSSQELSCVNDFVSNVTCIWKHPKFQTSSDCWVSGAKRKYRGGQQQFTIRSCKLKPHGEFPGCSFAFNTTFNPYGKMPNISVTCNGTLMGIQTMYDPKYHIKLHAPGTPNVSSTSNMTLISWARGGPYSVFFGSVKLHVQIKHFQHSWDRTAHDFVRGSPTSDVHEISLWQKLKGHLQVRARVKSVEWKGSEWSEWSPTTTWVAEDPAATAQQQASNLGQLAVFLPLALSLGLSLATVLALYRCCIRKRNLKEKTVPNPSQYFCTLHAVYGGNLKKWLNPMPVSEPFFVSSPCVDISAVEVCESWDAVPSGSPCSSTALVHSSPTSDPFSSCSSSCFSNMDYFMSSSNSSSSHTRPNPYFSYGGNVLSAHRKLHMSLCPPFISSSIYESLQREPQSPDSGFGVGRFEEQEVKVSREDQSSPPVLRLPLPVSFFSLPFSPLYPSDENLVFDNHGLEEDAPVAASPASEHLSAWPETEPMCRASSLPVDTSKSGYLTLKELHATFSNKSI